MVKVFSTSFGADTAGHELTKQFNDWKESFGPNSIEIENIHTTSNSYGWMLTVVYKIIR
jgi:hypothetical protein